MLAAWKLLRELVSAVPKLLVLAAIKPAVIEIELAPPFQVISYRLGGLNGAGGLVLVLAVDLPEPPGWPVIAVEQFLLMLLPFGIYPAEIIGGKHLFSLRISACQKVPDDLAYHARKRKVLLCGHIP